VADADKHCVCGQAKTRIGESIAEKPEYPASFLVIAIRLKAERSRLTAMVLPKSPVGDAVRYLANQWPALQRFTEDGHLAIDNNRAEANCASSG
jgi:hypothetical protein